MVKHKCNFCEKIINSRLDDFYKYDWEAIQFGKEKVIVACPQHTQDMQDFYTKRLTSNNR